MSKLAKAIVKTTGIKPTKTAPQAKSRPGPQPQCFPLYGPGDLEDWQAMDALHKSRIAGTGERVGWRGAQLLTDAELGITKHLPLESYRYHWRRRCSCWPEDLRL